jgi:hypothetical protein
VRLDWRALPLLLLQSGIMWSDGAAAVTQRTPSMFQALQQRAS